MRIDIPDYKTLELKYLVLDYNGTIAVDGRIPDVVKERLMKPGGDVRQTPWRSGCMYEKHCFHS